MLSPYNRIRVLAKAGWQSAGKGNGKILVGGNCQRISFRQTTLHQNNKTMRTFEECVFQEIRNGNFIRSSEDCCDNSQVATQPQTNDFDKHQQMLREYEEAVVALNSLQSNAESLRSSLSQRKSLNSLEETKKYLLRSGLTLNDLETLSFIHVAGTKGKGSTCALTESILRSYGLRTGFFSSPHLVSLTERIRLNGQPISKKKLTQYFWPVFNALKSQQEYENDMPAYFKFLTILCFHVYLQEKVDAVILEVGIGGELDSTNVVPNTKTVGISSLGLEHTQLLGNTLREIAWQKAGIIKPNSRVYTSVQQTECLEVLYERAKEKNATIYQVPEIELYFKNLNDQDNLKNQLNIVTTLNGSLALQLAYDWLRHNRNGFYKDYEINKPFLTEKALQGLLNCSWPGRCQMVQFFNLNMHLDGAHTVESMQVCGEWFAKVSSTNAHPKILIFNTTGDRDSRKLLYILRSYSNFDLVCFVPNVASFTVTASDTNSVLNSQVEQSKRAQMHAHDWQDLCREYKETNTGRTFPSILASFQHIRNVYKDRSQVLDILVTGSIHLIGATILSLNELCKDLRDERS